MASTVTGMPLRTALPDSGSNSCLVGEHVGVDARRARRRRASATPGRSWPHPCGRLTTPGMIASVTSTGDVDRADPRRHLRPAPSARPSAAASSGWTCSVQRGLALHEHVDVVHPRVVRAQVAAADQHEAVVPACRPSDGRQPRRCRRATARGPARSCRSAVRSTSGMRGSSAPRSMPCGWSSSGRG